MIRDLDEDVYQSLVRRAAESGQSVPELLRTEAARIAARPTMTEWLARTRRRGTPVGRADVLSALEEQRGEWQRVDDEQRQAVEMEVWVPRMLQEGRQTEGPV